MWKLLILAFLATGAKASPFELTDKYVEDFQSGINQIIKESHETNYVEEHLDPSKLDEDEAAKHAETFDFIVVGGGSSGAVVASRLSEIPEWKVLLLEAGEPETPFTLVPALAGSLKTTTYNWGYKAEPQKTVCLGMTDNVCNVPSGKALGGTSAINSMLYVRGNEKDYDLWADNENKEWCYKDILPYFKKIENANLQKFDRNYHSQGGPVHVEEPQHVPHHQEVFIHAGKELGLEEVDYNGKHQIGISVPQVNTKHGKRDSSSQAYLVPYKNRPNLVVRPLSQVIEILIKPHTKEASGVKYIHGGKLFKAKAEKEVILSAGALNSPKLLMLSGVGPKEDLEHLGIEVLKDLPVGRNLKDHVMFLGVTFHVNETLPHSDPHHDLVELLRERKGPLAHPGPSAIAFIKTEASKDSSDYPDIQLILESNVQNSGFDNMKSWRIKREIYDSVWKPMESTQLISILVNLLHPKSTGVVKLKSKDPLNWPEVHLNLLTDPDDHDLITLVHGAKKAAEFGNTEAFKKIGAHLNHNPVPGCDVHEFGSDIYWKCAIRHISSPASHYTGTCKMGPHTDKEAVVDNRLKVHGIQKLRVADVSVIPVTTSGQTNAAAIMIGEKASDMIKHDWHREI